MFSLSYTRSFYLRLFLFFRFVDHLLFIHWHVIRAYEFFFITFVCVTFVYAHNVARNFWCFLMIVILNSSGVLWRWGIKRLFGKTFWENWYYSVFEKFFRANFVVELCVRAIFFIDQLNCYSFRIFSGRFYFRGIRSNNRGKQRWWKGRTEYWLIWGTEYLRILKELRVYVFLLGVVIIFSLWR